ncbi:MAG: ABC transporter permease [Rhodobacteraceae bacterium]|nr:ABC transporter permease [Paracoccaceae bacterium]
MLIRLLWRLLAAVPVVIGVTLIAFLILHLTPGDPVEAILGARATDEARAALAAELGLDRPLPVQYLAWLGRALTGDFGTSIMTRTGVLETIGARLPYTLWLTGSAFAIGLALGIPLGLYAATRQNRPGDHLAMGAAMALYSTADFWLALMLTIVFAIWLRWLPVSGARGWEHLVLPALALGLPQVGAVARLMRAETIAALREDYVLTARAKGLAPGAVLRGHVLRNALVPVVTWAFLALPWLIGGAVVIEQVFAWPGMGQLMYQAILRKDFPVIQALLLFIALLTVLSNILGDLAAAAIDPRIREGLA